jgi:hypothetical protein
MVNQIILLLALSFLPDQLSLFPLMGHPVTPVITGAPFKVEGSYDALKDETTVRLLPVKISNGQGKYVSIHMSPSFKFPGRSLLEPRIIDFELQTVVRGRLSTDLYVVFIIDGETVYLSSNRWAVKRPVPGRVWMGERLVFRMPYETYVKITKARTFAIKFDGVKFSVGEKQKDALLELLNIT